VGDSGTTDPDRGLRVAAPHAQGMQVGTNNLMVNQFLAAAPPMAWPVLVGRAPLRADAFQERTDLRVAVERALTATVTQVVVGGGGTGKTQLAAAVFEQARRNGADAAVWVTASSRTGVLASYAQAYAATHAGAGTGDTERDAAAFLAWLATTDRSWIVVLDDVADPGDLARLWPTGSGRVLVTTRRRDAAMAARGPVVDVGGFSPEESLDYLTAKLTPATGVPVGALSEAAELAAELGYLPLALAQAASVIVNDAITCAAYRVLLADVSNSLADLFPAEPGASGDEYDQTLAGTWSLAADRADALAPVGLARPLLHIAAVLDANGIPESVFTGRAVRTYLRGEWRTPAAIPVVDDAGVSVVEARRALRNLHRLSLASHDPNDSVRSVRIHALAQRSAVEGLAPDRLTAVVRVAADALSEAWPDIEREPGVGQVLRANTSALARRDPAAMVRPAAHPVLFRTGRSLGETGLVTEAVAHFQALFTDCLRQLGPDHPDALSAQYELAYWRGEAGDFAGAAAALVELLDARLRVLGPDHPDTLGTRAGVAYWRGHAGDPAGAAAATEQMLADSLRVLGPDHPINLSARHNLAHWLGQAGDPAAAVAAYEQLLTDQARALGPNHADTLDTRRNLAHWRGQAGDPAAAVKALEQVRVDYERVLGPDHPDTLHTRDNLARWRGQAGDPAGAAAAYEELFADRLRVHGPDHPHTLIARGQLAEWRGHAGDPVGAVAGYQEVLADQLRVLGPDHPHSLTTRYHLGSWLGDVHGATTAVAMLEELVRDRTRILGADHLDTLAAQLNLGDWRGRADDATGATTALQHVLTDTLRVLGPEHPQTLAVRHNLAYWRGHAGDIVGAIADFQQLLTDEIRILPSDHPETLEARAELADLQARSGDVVGAVAAYEQLLADRLRVLGPAHPATEATRADLVRWRTTVAPPDEDEPREAAHHRVRGLDPPANR